MKPKPSRPDMGTCMARTQKFLGLEDCEIARAIGIKAKAFRDIRGWKRKPDAKGILPDQQLYPGDC